MAKSYIYLDINTEEGKFKNLKTNEILSDHLALKYYEEPDNLIIEDINDYIVVNGEKTLKVTDAIKWNERPYFAFIKTNENKVIRIDRFSLVGSDDFFSVIINKELAELLNSNLDKIYVRRDLEFISLFVEGNNFPDDRFIFYIDSNDKEVKSKINEIRLKTLRNNINNVKEFNISNGIMFSANNDLIQVLYTEKDKYYINNPYIQMGIVVLDNNGAEIQLRYYEYLRLKKELEQMELYNNIYAKCLYNYLEKNVDNIDLDKDYIYYGYMNDEILEKVKEEMSNYEIFK